MKFVTYNIQVGVGRDAGLDLQRTARTVAGADVIALQEVTLAWPSPADGDQPQQLAEHLHSYHWVYAPSVNVPCPLDYGFISAALSERVRSARIDNDAHASDHQPVWFEIDL